MTGRRAALLGTALLAAATRAVYLLESAENPFRTRIGLDMAGYDRWARSILEGHGLGEAPFTQAPLFPLLLALAYRLLGPDPVAALWFHLLPAAGATFLIAEAAGRWRGTAAAWGAGILAAILKPAVFYTGTLLPPAWAFFVAALACWSTIRLLVAGGTAAGSRGLLGAGSSFGLLALAQPVAALSAAPAALWIGRALPPRARRRGLLLFGAGLTMLPLLTFLYNGLAGRTWTPIAVNGGINLYIGNGPEANGAYVRPPEMREDRDLLGIEAAQRLRSAETGSPSSPSVFGPGDADRFWRARAVSYALGHLPRTLGLYGRKLLLFCGQYEVPQVESLPFEARYSAWLRLPWPGMAALLGLAMLGAFLLRRDPTMHWLAASAAAVALGVCLFFVTARFRLPAMPFLAVLAGAGIAEAGAQGRDPVRRRALLAPAAVGLAVGLVLSLNLAGLDRRASNGQYHFRLGVIREKESRPAEAMAEYGRALALDPTLGKAEVNLGTLLARAGRLVEARRHLERGVGLDPQSAIGLTNLGQLHQLQGRPDLAVECFRRALAVDPAATSARQSWAAILHAAGRDEEARRLLAEPGFTPPSTRAPSPPSDPSAGP